MILGANGVDLHISYPASHTIHPPHEILQILEESVPQHLITIHSKI